MGYKSLTKQEIDKIHEVSIMEDVRVKKRVGKNSMRCIGDACGQSVLLVSFFTMKFNIRK
jgi:hypothetical protein